VVPIFILIAIAIPSFRLLYYQDVVPEADMSINITGHQWYWTYEYPDYDSLTFDANMMPVAWFGDNLDQATLDEKNAAISDIQRMLDMPEAPEVFRLLEADTRVVVPVNKTVKIVVTADDVLHAWAIPAFGVKIDTIPGRTNEQWFRAEETGTYYGQCSELCGIYHAFMPIVVEVVTEAEFEAWLGRAKAVYASNKNGKPSRLAAAN
jgi:cytochrome c oxidase subunit 2